MTFACQRCGYSCTQIVVLSEAEIVRIEAAGHKRQDFLEVDGLGRKRLKIDQQDERYCHFFQWENVDGKKRGKCSIYEHRPNTCRKYPFFPESTAECTALRTLKRNPYK